MKQALPFLLLLAAFLTSRAAEPTEKDAWSETVNGLRARLVMGEGTVFAGDHLPEVYLELHNAADLGNPMEFDFKAGQALRFELRTAAGQPFVNQSGSPSESGFVFGPFQITLPHEGTLKFPITWHGYGMKPNFGTMLCFENAYWEIPRTDHAAYFLSAILKVPETPRDPARAGSRWHGLIMLPPVKVPIFK